MEKTSKLYQDLFKLFKNAHPNKTGPEAQSEFNATWREKIRSSEKSKINKAAYETVWKSLKEILNKRKNFSFRSFFQKPATTTSKLEKASQNLEKEDNPETSTSESQKAPDNLEKEDNPVASTSESQKASENLEKEDNPVEVDEKKDTSEDDEQCLDDCLFDSVQNNEEKEIACPAQDTLKEKISAKNEVLAKLYESKQLCQDAEASKSVSDSIKAVTEEKKKLEKKLKKKISDQKAKKKQRRKEKENLEQLKINNPELAASLKLREKPGRPTIECDQPGLLNDMLQIATIGAACDERRREEIFKAAKTLDNYHQAITNLGYTISRSALYLRLIPRRWSSNEGKRHVNTINVKLIRPSNNLRKGHPDRIFAAESCKAVEEIASFLGPGAAIYISQDDKSSVPLGIVAAKRQTTILMNMRYRLRLPDHDFRVGSRHLLTPSVIALCNIDPSIGVTYSGPTFVAVRSAKHNGSTAYTHNEDLRSFVETEKDAFKMEGSPSDYKPVWIKSVDGGPDENPRFEKNMIMGCKTFIEYDLDCLIEITNAPGLSAYNKVERKMFHLSKELTGIVLPYDTFGSHLDSSGKTIDQDLEVQNFNSAGEVLAGLWHDMQIDGYKVTSKYVSAPVQDETVNFKVSPIFRDKHIFETQYMSVYLKCDDRSCCSAPKTVIESFFPHRRIPALIPIKRTPTGPKSLEIEKDVFKKDISFPNVFGRIILEPKLAPEELYEKYQGKIPYDSYFPTQQEVVDQRTCTLCMKYHSSKKSLKMHNRICPQKESKKRKQAKKRPQATKRKLPNTSGEVVKRSKRQQKVISYDENSGEENEEDEAILNELENEVEDQETDPVNVEDEEADLFIVEEEEDFSDDEEVLTEDEEDIPDNVDLEEDAQHLSTISVPTDGGFEKILNLREWVKLPWVEG